MVLVGLKETMRAGAARMDDAFRDPLMVKMRDLFPHDEVFKQRRPTRAGLEGVLVVSDLHTLVGAQGLAGGVGAKLFQAVEFGVGVGAIRGIGSGHLAFIGRRLLAHQS
ncbi:hypothetical protein D3C78_1573780 [compost metagenome]